MSKKLLQNIIHSSYQIPKRYTLETMLPILLKSLGSPDPYARDNALDIFNRWLAQEKFSFNFINDVLLERCLEGMRFKIGHQGDDSVFVRSYNALLLLELLHYHNKRPFLKKRAIKTIHKAVIAHLTEEKDLRVIVPGKGWAYALPHITDNFWKLAESEMLGQHDLEATLTVIGNKLKNSETHIYQHFEDERFAYATLAVLKQNIITANFFRKWVSNLTIIPTGQKDAYGSIVMASQEDHATYINVRNFLRSLNLQLALRKKPPKGAKIFATIILEGIKRLDPGFYTFP